MKRFLFVTTGAVHQSDRIGPDDIEAFDNGAIVEIIDTHGPSRYVGHKWEPIGEWLQER